MGDLKELLFRMRQQLRRLLQRQQLGNANVALVVSVALSFEDRSGMTQTSSRIWPSFFFFASR